MTENPFFEPWTTPFSLAIFHAAIALPSIH
jgi:hypothetical protein